MSWIDQINNVPVTITTGDGIKYYPKWLPTSKSYEYNFTEFLYPNVKGSDVDRRQPKGCRYELEFYFDGVDYIDVSKAFGKSSENPKAWKLTHPIFGNIYVQPVGLKIGYEAYSVAKCTTNVIETIGGTPKPFSVLASVPASAIQPLAVQTVDALNAVYVAKPLDTENLANLKYNNNSMYLSMKDLIALTADANKFINLFNAANTAINDAITAPLAAIRLVQQMINAPYQFADTVQNRMAMLVDAITGLNETVATLINTQDKRAYENNVGGLLVSLALTGTGAAYSNRDDILTSAEVILSNYNGYVTLLDSMKTANNGHTNSYIPDYDSQFNLVSLVSTSINYLFSLVDSAKQQRVTYTEYNSNPISICYKYLGVAEDDYFFQSNNFTFDEMIQVLAGRKIVYYV